MATLSVPWLRLPVGSPEGVLAAAKGWGRGDDARLIARTGRLPAAGAAFVWRTKLILATITLDLFAVLLGGATYLMPVFAKDILGVGSQGLGFLLSAEGIGAVSMAHSDADIARTLEAVDHVAKRIASE